MEKRKIDISEVSVKLTVEAIEHGLRKGLLYPVHIEAMDEKVYLVKGD